MACSIPYLNRAPLSETERSRLEGLHVDIFDLAIASQAFRSHNNKLYSKKNDYAKATNFISRVNQRYGSPVATLQKEASSRSSEQFVLSVNVLPLSNEKQLGLNLPLYGSWNRINENNPIIDLYLPKSTNEPKDVIENLLRDETNPTSKKILSVMLANVEKIRTPVHKGNLRALNQELEMGINPSDINHISGVFHQQIRPIDSLSRRWRHRTWIVIDSTLNFTPEAARENILHELVHAYTMGVLNSPETPEEHRFIKTAKTLFEQAKLRLNAQNHYGLTNLDEFIAEIAASPQFRAALDSEGLLDRFIRAIRRLLGFGDTANEVDIFLKKLYSMMDNAQDLTRIGQTERMILADRGVNRVSSYNITNAKRLKFKKETKDPKAARKRIDALEEMLTSLKQRRTRFAHQGLGKQRQQTEKDIAELEKLMINKRNEAVVYSLLTIEREMIELQKTVDMMSTDPSKIDPDALRNIGIQLTSYEILNSFSSQIRRTPGEFIADPTSVPTFLKQLNELRSKVQLMEEDIKDMYVQRFAHVVSQHTNDPSKNFDTILDNLRVADRDVTWWNRWAETPRGVLDPAITATHKMIEEVYAKANRDTMAEDIYRKDSKKETLSYQTPDGFGGFRTTKIEFNSVGMIKAEEDYEKWVKSKGKNPDSLADKYGFILNKETLQANANGVKFISPLSYEGKVIRLIKADNPNYPLRQFYETVVMGYLKAQEEIKEPSMRPGLRIPSIQRSVFEGILREKGTAKLTKVVQENFIRSVRRRSDDNDFRAVNENMEPIRFVPIRFVAKQDGVEGRMSTREVSLDVASTVSIFMDEMRTRKGMLGIVSDLEIGKEVLAERKVVKSTERLDMAGIGALLTNERKAKHDPESGLVERMEGTESQSYQMLDTMMRRFVYGEYKSEGGEFKVAGKKYSVRKVINTLLKYTGLNIMLGNIAIPVTNWAVGELTMFKEAIGGNLITTTDLAAGHKIYKDVALGSIADLGEREKKSKWGRVFMYFNPMDNERPADNLGVDSTWMRKTIRTIFRTGNATVEYKLASETLGAVFNRFKVEKDGKSESMYEGIEVDMNGKLKLLPGYTYLGKNTLPDNVVDDIRNYTLRVYQLVNGNYTRLDAPGATETVLGDLVMFMRKWLPEGVAARWKTKHYDESLKQEMEGHYVSALIAFNGIFTRSDSLVSGTLDTLRILTWFGTHDPELLLLPNELGLSEDKKEEIIKLRQAGIRKTLVEMYLVLGLTVALFALSGGDDDDEYLAYMVARVRRELMTYASPTTAWDVLRSPTVAMNTIGGFHRIINDVGSSLWAVGTGEDQPVYQSGPGKGHQKLPYDIGRQLGTNFYFQFKGLEQKTRLISGGGWR